MSERDNSPTPSVRNVYEDEREQSLREREFELVQREKALLEKELQIVRQQLENTTVRNRETNMTSVNFRPKDVVDLIPEFDPAKSNAVALMTWIEKINKVARTYRWADDVTMLQAISKLRGAAKTWYNGFGLDLTGWNEFRVQIIKAFPTTFDEADVHAELMAKKKRRDESYEQYFYGMLLIGKKCDIKESSMIKYIISGLDDEELVKTLSIANYDDVQDLLKKMKIYEETINQNKLRKEMCINYTPNRELPADNSSRKERQTSDKNVRCYNCGVKGHVTTNCADRDKGTKCFNCNVFGHKANACPKKEENNKPQRTLLLRRGVDKMHKVIEERIKDETTEDVKDERIKDETMKDENEGRIKDETTEEVKEKRIKDEREAIDSLMLIEMTEVKQEATVPEEVKDIVRNYQPNAVKRAVTGMKIVLTDDIPVKHRPRRLPQAEITEVNKEIEKLLNEGIIIPSISDYASSVIPVRCKNGKLQLCVGYTPFEVMFGKKMRTGKELELKKIIEKEVLEEFTKERETLRKEAKKNILKIQEENQKNYKRKRKKARVYNEGDRVAIKRTQFGSGLKLRPKYLGPYEVSRVKRKNRYDVRRVAEEGSTYPSERPNLTSSSADNMKPWAENPESVSEVFNSMFQVDEVDNPPGWPNCGIFEFGANPPPDRGSRVRKRKGCPCGI